MVQLVFVATGCGRFHFLELVPQQQNQVPFLKETAVTSPDSLNQYFQKWKRTQRHFQDWGGEIKRENNETGVMASFLDGKQDCFIFHTPNLLGTINTLTFP